MTKPPEILRAERENARKKIVDTICARLDLRAEGYNRDSGPNSRSRFLWNVVRELTPSVGCVYIPPPRHKIEEDARLFFQEAKRRIIESSTDEMERAELMFRLYLRAIDMADEARREAFTKAEEESVNLLTTVS